MATAASHVKTEACESRKQMIIIAVAALFLMSKANQSRGNKPAFVVTSTAC